MHQTISGETRKVEVKENKLVLEAKQKILEDFKINDLDFCVYKNKLMIKDHALNFLNVQSGNNLYTQMKYVLRQGYDDIESVFPYLGDLFLYDFLDVKYRKSKPFLFQKSSVKSFVDLFKSIHAKNIANFYLNHCNLNNFIQVSENSNVKDIVIRQSKKLTINLPYDYEYFGNQSSYSVSNYKFIIIDGQIESEGEIHHLLHKAETTKEPYVIFCYGFSPEVKSKIIKLNSEGRVEILPIDIDFNEETVNILADIATLHNSDVVSSLKGQTISGEIRKSLSSGKSLTVMRNKIAIEPVCSDLTLLAHRKYLSDKKTNAGQDVDTSYLTKRIKAMNKTIVEITYPSELGRDVTFLRELDFFMKIMRFIDEPLVKVDLKGNKRIIPLRCLNYLKENVNIFKERYNNIETALVLA